MNGINEEMSFLNQIITLLENQFGRNCEVVLHNLTGGYEHTIVDIRNGHVTGRKIGDCGSNLGLEVLRGTMKDGDCFNYITQTKDNKILRSSSIYIRNDKNEVIGSICVNLDITDSVRYEGYLKDFNNYQLDSYEQSGEVFFNDVNELLEHFFQKGQQFIGTAAALMNKDERMEFIRYLDEKGAFLITKSGEKTCELLNVSKFVFYQYLDAVRKKSNDANA